MILLETPLLQVPGISGYTLARIAKMGILTVEDLLLHFPTRYEDYRDISLIASLSPNTNVSIQGIITSSSHSRSARRHMSITEAVIQDDSGSIQAIWFNQPYITRTLQKGSPVRLAGKVAVRDATIYLAHPTIEQILEQTEETLHTARLVSIYPETKGITSKGIRTMMSRVLKSNLLIEEWIPEHIRATYNIPEISRALRAIHFPKRPEDATSARRRFMFEKLFLIHLSNLSRREILSSTRAPGIATDISDVSHILNTLPFQLTNSQKRSLWEIIQDIARPTPMNRLLEGDVGSGKTVVAIIASLLVSKAGHQTAFMAPTEVLARQHFETMKTVLSCIIPRKNLETYIPTIAFLSGKIARILYDGELETSVTKKELQRLITKGNVRIIFGTHALIARAVSFSSLGLTVIDEQHRFGVQQRSELTKEKNTLPHFLSMSATPIPRTLMLSVFGDLDLSIIDELPKNRKAITTKIISPEHRQDAYMFMRNEIKNGRQAFIVCPNIDPQKNKHTQLIPDATYKSVKEEYEMLSKHIFPEFSVHMLHGSMNINEKASVMKQFREGICNILVATSIIEVGVDVPNATVMVIENSERFGLAQLYQFRGRVGRGTHQSYCFLFIGHDSKEARNRLDAIIRAKNGLQLAEIDLRLRGPGEFIGIAQSGFSDFSMQALQNPTLVKTAKIAAEQTWKNRASLHLLRKKLEIFEKTLHRE